MPKIILLGNDNDLSHGKRQNGTRRSNATSLFVSDEQVKVIKSKHEQDVKDNNGTFRRVKV